MKIKTEEQRDELKARLAQRMLSYDAVFTDAVWEGRVGLEQMTDAELLLEAEIWDVEVPE